MNCDPRRPALALLAVLCALAAGCSGPKPVPVSGRVTLDAVDLAEGEIVFVPADPSKRAESGKIADGRFEVAVWPGPHKVKVNAARELPKKGQFPSFESIIPERYNEKTELTIDVPAGGVSDKHFELTGGKKK